ncbi:hypothetical protein [Fusibacillus kribbianus]|uniref:Uncharacterized protein n=1 Tax=Fusibacillus kribbianus TaxID=3044208 RepID=A0AAP4BBJ5_9FIRM|nr:hypothetical protein [Ruminococcus sp. YH-rum2234]MDI9242945.1 hypothetical protein [Ruminococcus sp. YH-rum2234]
MPRPKKEYTHLNIKLDKEVSDILDAYCEETGATKTAAVEIAVKRCFASYVQNDDVETGTGK